MSASAPSQTIFSIGYDFHIGNGTTGADNGNVYNIYNYRDRSRDQSFTYDSLNRLLSAQNAGTNCAASTVNGKTEYWGNNYSYDSWGNLTTKSVSKCSAEAMSLWADGHNWAHAVSGTDYQYDAAGNMTLNATAPATAYSYDAENRITGAAGYTYTYDADGNRVQKSNGAGASNGTLYWYMTPGIIGESDLAGTMKSEYVFFKGERVARRDLVAPTGVFYYFSDHLKTASVITDSAGVIKSESDYYPWGGELQFTNADSNHYKFTGKERDSETQLDYFGARYYSNGLGRFITPDWAAKPVAVPYANFGNPQTLNLYSYMQSDPKSGMDPDGHCGVADGICAAIVNYISNWAAVGITKEGGKQFAKDAGIGAAKSVGSAAYHTVMQSNPVTSAIDHHVGEPKALQPKNDAQAGAKNITTGLIAAASVVVPAALESAAPSALGSAQSALDAAVSTRAANPAVMVGAVDATTGTTAVGTSGPLSRLGTINPNLAATAQQVGGVGAMNPGAPSPVGCCAEFDAANQLMNQGSVLDNIQFTDAVRPRTGAIVPKCSNCEAMFPERK